MIVFILGLCLLLGLIGRLVFLMVFDAEYYQKKAEDLHKRERKIKAARGLIVDEKTAKSWRPIKRYVRFP